MGKQENWLPRKKVAGSWSSVKKLAREWKAGTEFILWSKGVQGAGNKNAKIKVMAEHNLVQMFLKSVYIWRVF